MKKRKKIKKALTLMLVGILLFGLILTLVGYILCGGILQNLLLSIGTGLFASALVSLFIEISNNKLTEYVDKKQFSLLLANYQIQMKKFLDMLPGLYFDITNEEHKGNSNFYISSIFDNMSYDDYDGRLPTEFLLDIVLSIRVCINGLYTALETILLQEAQYANNGVLENWHKELRKMRDLSSQIIKEIDRECFSLGVIQRKILALIELHIGIFPQDKELFEAEYPIEEDDE